MALKHVRQPSYVYGDMPVIVNVVSFSYLGGSLCDSGRAEALDEFISTAFVYQLRHSFLGFDVGIKS